MLQESHVVVDVHDQYGQALSVKSAERKRRAVGHGHQSYQVIGGRTIPPWKKFLAVDENKQALQEFLCNYVVAQSAQLPANHPYKIYLAGGFSDGNLVKVVSSLGINEDAHLHSSQEGPIRECCCMCAI